MKRILLYTIFLFASFLLSCNNEIEYHIICRDDMKVGEKIELSHDLSDISFEWIVSNDNVFIEDDYLIALKEGTTIITLKYEIDGKEKSINKEIKVNKNTFTFSIISESDCCDIIIGESQKYIANVPDSFYGDVIWSSSDEEVLTVTDEGVVTGVSIGEAFVKASYLGNESTLLISIGYGDFAFSIDCEKKVYVNDVVTISVNTEIDGDIVWESSDEEIAQVNNGVVTFYKTGKVQIKATLHSKEAFVQIEVVNYPKVLGIIGSDNVKINSTETYVALLLGGVYEKVHWSVSDPSIASIDENGVVTGIKKGTVIIYAQILDSVKSIIVNVGYGDFEFYITGETSVYVGESITLKATASVPGFIEWKSMDESIATVIDGIVFGVSEGVVCIKAYLHSKKCELLISVVKPTVDLEIIGNTRVYRGENVTFQTNYDDVVWECSNNDLCIFDNGFFIGTKLGTVVISAYLKDDPSIRDDIEVIVQKIEDEVVPNDVKEEVDRLLSQMTIRQKLGQLFIVGFSGTTLNNDLINAIEEYHFGNVIYLGYNLQDPYSIEMLTNSIQEVMVNNNTVPGFICIDQEGGRVTRLTNGGTHFISNMGICATGDYNSSYYQGLATGKELRSYGINFDFAPVMDVNNEPNNPVIGVRSYSDDPVEVSLYGGNLIKGLREANVLGCAKHFPGHGNTSTDSHYNLPSISSSMDELLKMELVPFMSASSKGIDSIMTTHIVFKCLDSLYPATLSKKVLTGLLREELNYQGLIVTDGMEMKAVSQSFGDYDQTAVMAFKAGADLLTYTTIKNPMLAYQGLLNAYNRNEITEEEINESVRRILQKKLMYNIINDYNSNIINNNTLLEENRNISLSLAEKSLTLVKGSVDGIDKNEKTLIVSPTTTYNLGNENSFASYAAKYLNSRGYDCEYIVVNNNITNNERDNIYNNLDNYDNVILAFSNIKTGNVTKTINFVNNVIQRNRNAVVIALDSPYDLMVYKNCKNYVCVYGYQEATVIALSKFLCKEIDALGKFPLSMSIFE